MSNLRDRRPNAQGAAHRDLLTASLQSFDRVFDDWSQTRGLGGRGSIRGSHARNPFWENELVSGSMGRFPASAMDQPCCYLEACDLTCPNNQRILAKLEKIAEEYSEIANPWTLDFEIRLNLIAEVPTPNHHSKKLKI